MIVGPTLSDILGRMCREMAEVGVYEGVGAKQLRAEFPRAKLYLIDPWTTYRMSRSYAIDNSPPHWLRAESACRRRFGNDRRAVILKMTGREAARQIPDASLDVVRLDAGRTRKILTSHLDDWVPKIKPGGVLCGDGLAGYYRRAVRKVLNARFGTAWIQQGRTRWAIKL